MAATAVAEEVVSMPMPAHRRQPRFEVEPSGLLRVADVFDDGAARFRRTAARLDPTVAGAKLNGADPDLDPTGFRQRLHVVHTRLAELAASLAVDGRTCRNTAVAAEEADAITSTGGSGTAGGRVDNGLCRLPAELRRPLDQQLTDAIGDLVEHTTRAGITVLSLAGLSLAGLSLAGRPSTVGADSQGRAAGPGRGDRGGTNSSRALSSVAIGGTTDRANVVDAALALAGDPELLAPDEFGLIDHGDNRFTVVLPGVVDLSHPHRGWDPHHRSVRDLDQVAIASSRQRGPGTNLYADMVADGLAANGVEPGAELLIVGHSFGADTALDLAADPAVVDRYRLTHIVAAGYNSQPQLPEVPDGVAVLVLQNSNDLVIRAETIMPTDNGGVLGCGPGAEAGGGAGRSDIAVVDFDGGLSGLGHSVEHYRAMVDGDRPEHEQEPTGGQGDAIDAINTFIARVERAGFTVNRSESDWQVTAIDVSVPEGG